ncbi:hypothetical protein BGW41_008062 [Actinomortierella wolfii]|nr:hypothetical protein BGW41_008062 [Actinomortierella wolfii]
MTSTLDPRGEVIAIDVDQPLDEAYVKKITHSLTELLEEYKSVSDHILKSLVLSTRNATDMCASTSGPGHGDYSKANGEAECIHDPDELEKENARLLKSQYLEILSDVSALPIAEIDNLDRLVNADHERFQKLTEPLDNIWVSLLMMESDSAKTSKTSSPRSFRETFSAFISSFLPAS